MNRTSLRFVTVVLSTIASLVCAPALAGAEPGEGIQSENFRLSLNLDTSASTNSNLFFEENPSRGLVWSLGVTPSMKLATVDPKLIDFALDWSIGYQQMLSTDEVLLAQSGLSTTLGASAHINAKGNFSLRLEEGFTRTNEAPNTPSTSSIHRFVNTAGAILGVHPGGRVIQGFVGYHLNSTFYNFDETNLEQLNKDEHAFDARVTWTFLPQTSAVLLGQYSLINYDEPARVIGNTSIPNINSRPITVRAGLNGLVLKRLAVKLLAGYGAARYVDGDSFSGIVGTAKATYYLTANKASNVTLAYERGFQDSTLGNFQTSHIIGLLFSQALLNQQLKLDLGANVEFREYDLTSVTAPLENGGSVVLPEQINDTLISGRLGANYALRKWMSFGGRYTLKSNVTQDDVQVVTPGAAEVTLGRSYVQHMVSIYLRLTY